LQQLGWTNGQNLEIDALWTNGDESRIAQLAKELVAREPAVILARATPVTTALRKETRTIPIVFVVVSDPVGAGLVDSMARPGGNITGFTNAEASLGWKVATTPREPGAQHEAGRRCFRSCDFAWRRKLLLTPH